MPAKLTQDIAVERARNCHEDLYNLSKLVYTEKLGLVSIGCRKHGFFDICYRDFTKPVNARGCQACSKELYAATRGEAHNKIGEAEAIERMVTKHADKFDYSAIVYSTYAGDVAITCSVHGKFSMSPQSHTLSQYGCPGCSRDASALGRTIDHQKNVNTAVAVFGNLYDYSSVPKNICTKTAFTITCKVHGPFLKTWNEHKQGAGCPVCAELSRGDSIASDTTTFVVKAEKIHGQRYDYSAVNYHRGKAHVEIRCREHGTFFQKPNHHLSGQGCNACVKNGFRVLKPANLYVLKSGDITKVGITNRTVHTRLREINACGKGFTVLHTEGFESGQMCLDAETALLKYLRGKYDKCQERFHGSTECFLSVDFIELRRKIAMVVENE